MYTMKLKDLLIEEGGAGSDNYGHVGIPGKRGGSQSNKSVMSLGKGKTAAERQQKAKQGKKESVTKKRTTFI